MKNRTPGIFDGMNSSAWFYRVFADRWLWCILLFGLALRLYKIDSPILDGDSFRQGATASIARNYYENGFELLNPRITGWGTIHEAGLWPNEFPLYPFVVACLYVPLGEHVWIGRLLTALFCLVGAAGLYALIKRLEHPLTARFAALWYLIAPQAVYHGRCFHRHPVAIGLMLVALAAFAKWVEEKKPAPWIGMTVCAALALLMMPPLVFCLIPAYVIYRQLADRSWWKNGWIWLAGGLMFLPALLWYSWAYQQYASYSLSSHGREDFRNWTSAHYYLLWWKHDLFYQVWRTFWDYTLGPLGATFAAAGLFLIRPRAGFLPQFWTLTVLTYYVLDVYPVAVVPHYVYYLILLPALAWSAARFTTLIWEHLTESTILALVQLRQVFIGIVILATFFQFHTVIRPWYHLKQNWLRAAQAIKDYTPPHARVIVDNFDPSVIYQSRRMGLAVNPPDLTLELLQQQEQAGATHLAITQPEPFFQNEPVRIYLKETARNVLILDYIRLYELGKKQ